MLIMKGFIIKRLSRIYGIVAVDTDPGYRVDLLFCLVYFFLWSDLWELQDQKVFIFLSSVEGMNFDFVAMNLTGFIFYSLYNSYGFFINSDQTGQVDLNDVIFGYHAMFATLVCIFQIFLYPRGKNSLHIPTVVLLITMWSFILLWSILTLVIIFL